MLVRRMKIKRLHVLLAVLALSLCAYPILGISGALGPKMRQGDMQVPEGLYRVESLNPNSDYHLALRVNYPNGQDRLRGKQEGRSQLGSDIMIHGNTCSIGCLAMGDEAAEDLFILAAETGIDNVLVILAPVDFRTRDLPDPMPALPPWAGELYGTIKEELRKLGGQQPQAACSDAHLLRNIGRC